MLGLDLLLVPAIREIKSIRKPIPLCKEKDAILSSLITMQKCVAICQNRIGVLLGHLHTVLCQIKSTLGTGYNVPDLYKDAPLPRVTCPIDRCVSNGTCVRYIRKSAVNIGLVTCRPSRSPKVIGTDTDQSGTDCLLVIYSNHGPVSHRFPDKRRYMSGNPIFPTPCIERPADGAEEFPCEFCKGSGARIK